MFRSSTLFLAVPVVAIMTLNICFLIQVMRILKSKLETEPALAGSSLHITLKSAKAVLMLIPIFGLQFLLLPVRPGEGSSLEYLYQIFSSISTSTQGITVSVLLCFSNKEIQTNIQRALRSVRDRLELYKL